MKVVIFWQISIKNVIPSKSPEFNLDLPYIQKNMLFKNEKAIKNSRNGKVVFTNKELKIVLKQ
jgi:hypothetical protein